MLHREVIHSGKAEYTIIKIDSHRVLVDQFKQDGDMGSRGTWVFDTRVNHPTLLSDYVLSKIHIMLNEPEIVWVVGAYLGTTRAKDLAWEIVAICSSEVEALKITLDRPQYVNYFIGPMELDGPPVHESKDWEGAYYPVDDRNRVRRTLAEVGIPLEDVFLDANRPDDLQPAPLPVVQQILDKIGDRDVVGGFHSGLSEAEFPTQISMDAEKLVGSNYLSHQQKIEIIEQSDNPDFRMPVVTDWDIIDHLNKEIQVARDFMRTHHLSAKFQCFQEKYMETPEPMTRDLDPTGKDYVTVKSMSKSWWDSFNDEEKQVIASKYKHPTGAPYNAFTEDDIFDLFVYEHQHLKTKKEESKPCPQCNAANGDSHEFGCTYR